MTNAQWCADTTSYYLGKHAWYGGTEDSDFVKENLTKDYIGSRNFTLVGSLINAISTPDGATNYTRGTGITFDGSVLDDCGADVTSSSTIIYNMSTNSGGGYWAACTAGAGGDCVITTNSSFPVGFYNVTMTSSKSGHNNGTVLNESLFFLRSVPLLKNANISIRNDGWGVPRNFSINVPDN